MAAGLGDSGHSAMTSDFMQSPHVPHPSSHPASSHHYQSHHQMAQHYHHHHQAHAHHSATHSHHHNSYQSLYQVSLRHRPRNLALDSLQLIYYNHQFFCTHASRISCSSKSFVLLIKSFSTYVSKTNHGDHPYFAHAVFMDFFDLPLREKDPNEKNIPLAICINIVSIHF